MARARIALQPAWVLRSRPYGDTSLLLEVLTRGHGRVGLVARGARAPKARLRGVLQPFRSLLLSWTESGDLGQLTAAENQGPVLRLAGERVFSGWYLNELLLRVLPRHDPHPAVFDTYAATLAGLAGAVDALAAEAALRRFEMGLLAALGFGLEWPDPILAGASYGWDPDRGLQLLGGQAETGLPGAHLVELRDDHLRTIEALRTARTLLRSMLAPLLGERPLASAAILRQLRQRRVQ